MPVHNDGTSRERLGKLTSSWVVVDPWALCGENFVTRPYNRILDRDEHLVLEDASTRGPGPTPEDTINARLTLNENPSRRL